MASATWLALSLLLLLTPAAAQQPADPEPLCAGRSPCRVERRADAGRDDAGRALAVVELALEAQRADGTRCRDDRREFWLLVADARPRLLLDLCNDGYGAAGMGEDEVTIAPNQLVYAQYGGSNWRWEVVRTVRLSPLAVVSETGEGTWTVGPNREERSWDWTRLTGRARWWSPACLPGHHAPDGATLEDAPEPLPYEYAPIPRILEAHAPPGALTAALGSCATQVDAGGAAGFVIVGRADPRDAARDWLRVLAIGERDLLVTVGAGPWRRGAASWRDNDFIELWLGDTFGYATGCLARDERAGHWMILVADGAIVRSEGPQALRPQVVARREGRDGGAATATFHLRLAPQTYALTVALSRRTERTIATARMRGTAPSDLGLPMNVPAAALRCAVRDGRLDIVETGRPEMLLEP